MSNENRRLAQNIETATNDIEKLTAFITKTDNDIEVLGSERNLLNRPRSVKLRVQIIR